jgi:hypothetical protein
VAALLLLAPPPIFGLPSHPLLLELAESRDSVFLLLRLSLALLKLSLGLGLASAGCRAKAAGRKWWVPGTGPLL